MTEFIALDGEAIDDRYVLICNSDEEYLQAGEGLRTKQILEWLLERSTHIHRSHPRAVAFGLNYDVNMWLADLPKPLLKILWERQLVYWRGYKIRWVPRREFMVSDAAGRKLKVTEVWNFFQSSFVQALEDWKIAPAAEIEAMKARRGSFTKRELETGKLRRYCLQECTYLVALMQSLEGACVRAGIYPERWYGAGSLAAWLLREEEVAPHHRYDHELCPAADRDRAPLQTMQNEIMRAYFGARTEIFAAGPFEHVQSVDIRSAYPWALTRLRSLATSQLRHTTDFELAGVEVPSLWRVRWEELPGPVMPFPVRDEQRNIYYPRTGEGVYHGIEVRAALEAQFELELLDGWVLEPVSEVFPFRWIEALYLQRRAAEAEDSPTSKPLKLALNALYGKLAQGFTAKPHSLPRWQSYFWAGEVTARVRARMLTLALAAEEPLSLATDGLIARQIPADQILRSGRVLGSLESHTYRSLFLAQPGVYTGTRDDGEIVRAAGHFRSELDWEQIREVWAQEGYEGIHRYSSRRFLGLGSALLARRMPQWGTWPSDEHKLSLRPSRKGQELGSLRLAPPSGEGLGPSRPYTPKQDLNETDNVDDLQFHEQPLILEP